MTLHPTQVLAARWIVPVESSPIHRGWVRLAGEEVVEIGQGKPPATAIDLGDVALLPGLVNAHTHLEFSDCDKPIGESGIALSDWIGQVVASRGATTETRKQRAVIEGLQQSRDAGVRLVGEITTPPCEYPIVSGAPEIVSFAEVLGLSEERAEDRVRAAIEHHRGNDSCGWSPHSPYSTTPDLIRRCVRYAAAGSQPLAMHVAESPEERELIVDGTGPFAEALKRMGVWKEGLFPWAMDGFVDLIRLLSGAPRALLIHGNDLREAEIDCVASYENLSVVYCPRTHAFFRHGRHPVHQMIQRGIPVALGTDSRASNPDLCLWKEVQYLLNHRGDLAPDRVLEMATINGAESLMRYDVGKIAVGSRPGFGVIATDATNRDQLWAAFATNAYVPISDEDRV